jgi:DNA (cytosine-5)-methyltransferase 1
MVDQISYIDIFAGCGGISLGLAEAGLKGLFAIERNPDAFQTFNHNLIGKGYFEWPEWLPKKNWNINTLIQSKYGELMNLRGHVDLVVGGPPCQGFSPAGRRKAYDDRNKLIHSYLDFVELVQPRAIMFENVRGFTFKYPSSRNHNEVAFSEIVVDKLTKLGYTDAHGEMIDVSIYGVPQHRRRFVVIATREKVANDIFAHLENDSKKFLALKGLETKNSVFAALSDLERRHGAVECPDSQGFMAGISSPSSSNIQRYLRLPNQIYYTPDSHRYVNHTPEVQETFKRLLDTAPRNKEIIGKEREVYGIRKRNVRVLDPNEPSPTITSIPDDFVHYSEPRVMTARECARLQSFPDWFEFKGPYTTGGKKRVRRSPRYTQIGNAVPPLFAEQIGLALKQVLTND